MNFCGKSFGGAVDRVLWVVVCDDCFSGMRVSL